MSIPTAILDPERPFPSKARRAVYAGNRRWRNGSLAPGAGVHTAEGGPAWPGFRTNGTSRKRRTIQSYAMAFNTDNKVSTTPSWNRRAKGDASCRNCRPGIQKDARDNGWRSLFQHCAVCFFLVEIHNRLRSRAERGVPPQLCLGARGNLGWVVSVVHPANAVAASRDQLESQS